MTKQDICLILWQKFCGVEEYKTVWQLTSVIEGRLPDTMDAAGDEVGSALVEEGGAVVVLDDGHGGGDAGENEGDGRGKSELHGVCEER